VTQVDFYILKDGSKRDRFELACLVTEKALNAGHRVVIHTPSSDVAQKMDSMLWTYSDQSFIPHELLDNTDSSLNAVLIGNAQSAHEEHDVLINLAADVPTFFSRFQRLAECVDIDEVARQSSRERYRFYRDRGYPLNTHEIA